MARKRMSKKSVYRSGFEEKVADRLRGIGIEFQYEPHKITWIKPESSHTYTPDIYCQGVYYELKGYFDSENRKRMLEIIKQHPHRKFCMVFQQPNKPIRKGSKTTYAMWCDKNKIDHCTVDEMIARLSK